MSQGKERKALFPPAQKPS